MESSAICDLHERRCKLSEERADLLVAGPPCQPFSLLGKAGRGHRPENHKDYEVTMSLLPQLIQARRPRAVLLEQVCSFSAYLKPFLDEVEALTSGSYKGVKALTMHTDAWANISRTRSGLYQLG
jgi:site-specific DNA-cytosine methylase